MHFWTLSIILFLVETHMFRRLASVSLEPTHFGLHFHHKLSHVKEAQHKPSARVTTQKISSTGTLVKRLTLSELTR
jgi:hypothetical protein